MRSLRSFKSRLRAAAFTFVAAGGAACCMAVASANAQTAGTASGNSASARAGSPASALGASQPTPAGGLKTLNLADYGRWNRITSTALSPDGRWMSYAYQPNDGDATLYVKGLDSDKLYTIPVGSAPVFSDDSKWVGYFVSPPERAGGGGGGAAGGGRGGRGGAPAPAPATGAPAAATRRFELLSLATGEKTPIPNASTFKFGPGSRFVAVRMNKAQPASAFNGADLIVRDLAGGSMRNIGNVGQYDFGRSGTWLAYTVDAAERIGNGVCVSDLVGGQTRALDASVADYDGLTWSEDGRRLAALRGDKVSGMRQKANVLLAWDDVPTRDARRVEWNPVTDATFPKEHVLSEYTAPRWSKDGAQLFVGIKEQEAEIAAADSLKANVDVWHWKDVETQATQMLRLQQDRRATLPAVVQFAPAKFVRLADTSMRTVTPTANGKWGIGRDDAKYRADPNNTQNRADYYRVNVADGTRTLIERNLTRTYGTSPDSKWFLYLKDKHVYGYNLDTGASLMLDASAKRLFIDVDDDHGADKPLYGVAGWTSDGRSVLLYDQYDIWQLPLDANGKAVNLTNGAGQSQQIVYRLARLGGGGGRGGRGGGSGDDDGVDLAKSQVMSAYGDRTKKSGYYELVPGQAPKPLLWDDKQIGQAIKADSADRVIFTQQTFSEYPDYLATNTKFASPRKVTDANPIIKEYAWGSKRLFDYTNSRGKKLQGTITLPAGYEKGKKYPMIVYQYEIMSNTHHTFSQPVYDDRPQMSTYASNGYIMMQPDIVYEIGKPGSSALDCVVAATKKVIELGYADPKHIGLQGHSWGGYESSFIVTQTDIFAAVVTGAPLTDYISMNNLLYKQTGNLNSAILETSQGRMGEGVTPYVAHDLWESQSPIFHVKNIKTPFLILQGTADGAVDWNQGLEFFNAARRNGKEVIFLSYPNEPHHLAIKENQKDFQTRMKQYFDHYLMDKPAPKWMTDGLPQTRKGSPIG